MSLSLKWQMQGWGHPLCHQSSTQERGWSENSRVTGYKRTSRRVNKYLQFATARSNRRKSGIDLPMNIAQNTEKQPLLNGAMAYLKVKMQVMMILTKQKMVEMSKTMSHGAMKLTLK